MQRYVTIISIIKCLNLLKKKDSYDCRQDNDSKVKRYYSTPPQKGTSGDKAK